MRAARSTLSIVGAGYRYCKRPDLDRGLTPGPSLSSDGADAARSECHSSFVCTLGAGFRAGSRALALFPGWVNPSDGPCTTPSLHGAT